MSRVRAVAATLGTVGMLATAAAPGASAHDYPVGHHPADGAVTRSQPGSVSVTFNDLVLTKPARPDLVVTGPDGRHYESGCATLQDHTVTVPAKLGPDGRYTTTWRVVSADGHPVSGSSTFSFAAAQGVPRETGHPSAPSCGESADGKGGSSVSAPVVVAGVALVGAALGVVLLLLRARRHPRP